MFTTINLKVLSIYDLVQSSRTNLKKESLFCRILKIWCNINVSQFPEATIKCVTTITRQQFFSDQQWRQHQQIWCCQCNRATQCHCWWGTLFCYLHCGSTTPCDNSLRLITVTPPTTLSARIRPRGQEVVVNNPRTITPQSFKGIRSWNISLLIFKTSWIMTHLQSMELILWESNSPLMLF